MERSWCALSLLALFTACGDDIPEGALVSQIVGPEGAHMEAPGLALDIPAGALGGSQRISIGYADAPMTGSTPLSPAFRMYPSGLQFAQPVSLNLSVPPGANGVVLWSSLGNEDLYGFSGVVDDGVAIAENTHFCDVATAEEKPEQGCDDREEGEPACPRKSGPKDCRRLCGCLGYDPILPNTQLCGYDPHNTDGSCPATTMLPPGAAGEDQFGERDGEVCLGWGWVPITIYLCTCKNAMAGPLCPLKQMVGMTGNPECHSTISYPINILGPPLGPPPKTPVASECVTGMVDRTKCDCGSECYVGASTSDTGGCLGFDTAGASKVGNLETCKETKINYEWRPFDGKRSGCRGFERSTDFPDTRPADDVERCRLTPKQWSQLQTRRLDCGVNPRAAREVEKANAPKDKLGRIYSTVAILSVPGEAGFGGYPELTGMSSRTRPYRGGSICPYEVPVQQQWRGIGYPYRRKDTGEDMNTETTKGHAEGNALLQLAEQRGRMPPEGDGSPMSTWYGTGGRQGGCAEMLVDRKPCGVSCAPQGLNAARATAGLDKLIVHSPTGCRLYTDYDDPDGYPCDEGTTCP